MKLKTLKDLYLDELKDVYDAENQLVRAIPKMIKAAFSTELKEALNDHLEKTRGQVERLVQIFEGMGEQPKRKKCDGMKGLIDEGAKLMEEDAEDSVMDAGLIGGAQRVEHYEMAAYGTLKAWAQQLGDDRAVELLEQTYEEEKEADETLSAIAESIINAEAAEGESGNSEESEGTGRAPARSRLGASNGKKAPARSGQRVRSSRSGGKR